VDAPCAWCRSIAKSTRRFGRRRSQLRPRLGCVPQTLLVWAKRQEVDAGVREGVTTTETQRIKDLECDVKELRRANEILKLASAFFAQAELDRRLK
jgi:transposase